MTTVGDHSNAGRQFAFGERLKQARSDAKVYMKLMLSRQEGVPATVLAGPVLSLAAEASCVQVVEY